MVLDHLNAAVAPHGLQFAPDVSTSSRATLGGMIANNSAGMYSVVYGKTIDHVLELRVMLADGTITTFAPTDADAWATHAAAPTLAGRTYDTVRRLARTHAAEVEARYPKVIRRVGGYNLDAFIGERPTFNMAHMIVGSEGTLAIVLAAKVRLIPRPAHTAIGIAAFATLDDALAAVVPSLACHPSAVELFDDILLDLTRRSLDYAQYLASFVQGEPGALLQIEVFGATVAETHARLDQIERALRDQGHAFGWTKAVTAAEKDAVLRVRKAGLPLLQSMSSTLRPETFVEDSAVPPERLADYVKQFRAICHDAGVRVAFYGHASVGLLHARPLLNLKDGDDVAKMRHIAEAIRDLVIEYGGALSGEHGDGMLRAEFNRMLFGDTLYAAFGEIKRTFDPDNRLNPGKIVAAPPMDTNLRYGSDYQATVPFTTHYRFDDTSGFAGAIELCNGNGLCRKTTGGTMCPSYMVTRDEEHSTRGRANALRMVLSGALDPALLTSERIHQTMDLCIECKGCTAECPSRVNMTRLKSEWLAHYHAEHGVPLRSRIFGNIHRINRWGSAFAPLSNIVGQLPGLSIATERVLGISRHRTLPRWERPFRRWWDRHTSPPGRAGQVVLFADTFARYNEPHIARAAVRVLEAAGYEVVIPAREVCCGRPMLSKGLLTPAKTLIAQQLDVLAPYLDRGTPIVGLEPSCILSFRDEYPDLTDDPRAHILAKHSFLIDEFLAMGLRTGAIDLPLRAAAPQEFVLHGHCHQKALVGTNAAVQLLGAIPAATVRVIDSGCCGMAGSFGYEAEHYDISQRIGERVLFPAVRAAAPEAVVVAMGTSCREQIAHGTGRTARHLVNILAEHV